MKKLAPLAAVAALALVTACGSDKGDRVDYEVSGTVVQQWMDYECSRSMGASAPEMMSMLGTSSSSGGKVSSSSSSTSGGGGKKADAPKSSSVGAAAAAGGAAAASGGSDSNKNKATPPAKVAKVPMGKPVKPKGYSAKYCSEEPELFIKEPDGDVFEQDVTRPHYDACSVKEQFPACTK